MASGICGEDPPPALPDGGSRRGQPADWLADEQDAAPEGELEERDSPSGQRSGAIEGNRRSERQQPPIVPGLRSRVLTQMGRIDSEEAAGVCVDDCLEP